MTDMNIGTETKTYEYGVDYTPSNVFLMHSFVEEWRLDREFIIGLQRGP